MEFYASCPEGFESALADELKRLGLSHVRRLKGRATFEGELEEGYRACLWSRVASRVFVVLGRFEAQNADELYDGVCDIAWESIVRPGATIAITARDVTEQLRRSSASDFGLRGELPYIDAVIAAVNDESNLLEKEHKIDRIRWQQAVDLAAEDYFNVNAVLSYLVRINLVARWTQLDEARGRAMLGRLLRELDGKELINNK